MPVKVARRRLQKASQTPASVSSMATKGMKMASQLTRSMPLDASRAGSSELPFIVGANGHAGSGVVPAKEGGSRVTGAVPLVVGHASSPDIPIVVPMKGGCAASETPTDGGNVAQAEIKAAQTNPKSNFISKNPFAFLSTDMGVERPTVHKDANPDPSKRARPTEGQTQRVISKKEKRKGKAIPSGSVTTQDTYILSAYQDPALGAVIRADMGVQSNCSQSVVKEVHAQPPQLEGCGHDSVVSCLKKAILGRGQDPLGTFLSSQMDSVVIMEDSRIVECSSQESEGGTPTFGGLSGNDMVEDQDESQPPLTIK